MAVFNFTYALSGNNQLLTQITAPPVGFSGTTTLTNTKDSVSHDFGVSWIVPFVGGGTLTAQPSDLGYTGTFASGVYTAVVAFSVTIPPISYSGTQYLLDTTRIDAQIAAYAPTNPTEAATLIWMQYLRTQIDTLSSDVQGNQALLNTLIDIIDSALVSPVTITTISSVSLSDNNTFSIVAINENGLVTPLNSPSNYVQNTVTGDYEYYEDAFLVPTASGSSSVDSTNTFFTPIYTDGCYFVYNFAGNNFSEATIRLARYYGIVVVTTTIDAEFATFEANYDPNNVEQAASYAAMLAAYAEIQTLSSSVNIFSNYDEINDQIAIIQANLALWVELDMSLVLTNKSLMTLTINTTLPNVVYSAQSLNLSNTNDDSQEYIVTTFPENYIDLTKTFSSSEINFGTQFEDGVYKLNLSWSAENSMEFSGVTYCLVMTQVDCGIAQVIANRPNCKNVRSQLNMLMLFRDMALDAYSNEDYTTCNFYINKCIIILNQSGCGCGCN
jgi:hypothetical protein